MDTYSINLMWIARARDPEQQYLASDPDQLIEDTKRWAEGHPEGTVNIWYDSQTTTPKQIDNTNKLIEPAVLRTRIVFKDVRDIDIVASNSDLFHHQIPIYWRVDLLKLIVVLDEVERNQQDCAVFADIGKSIIDKVDNKAKLFTDNIQTGLQRYGMLLGYWGENQFHQLAKQPYMQIAIKHFINMHLHAMQGILNSSDKQFYSSDVPERSSKYWAEDFYRNTGQVIHSSLKDLYSIYYALASKRPIKYQPLDSDELSTYHFEDYAPIAPYLRTASSLTALYTAILEGDTHYLKMTEASISYPITVTDTMSCPQRKNIGKMSVTHIVEDPRPTHTQDGDTQFKCTFYQVPSHSHLPVYMEGTPEDILNDARHYKRRIQLELWAPKATYSAKNLAAAQKTYSEALTKLNDLYSESSFQQRQGPG